MCTVGSDLRDARDRKIVEQSLRDMSTGALSPDISNDFSDVHHSVIWTSLWVPPSVTDIISNQIARNCAVSSGDPPNFLSYLASNGLAGMTFNPLECFELPSYYSCAKVPKANVFGGCKIF